MKITAYANKVSVAPGETIDFMVNCEEKDFKADIVQLICGDMNPDGPGYKEKFVKTVAGGVYKGRRQVIHSGSYIEVASAPVLQSMQSFTMQAFIWPTTPEKGQQTIISNWSERQQSGAALVITKDSGALGLRLGGGKGKVETITSGKALLAHEWYFVAASFDAKTKTVTLIQQALHAHVGMKDSSRIRRKTNISPALAHADPLLIGAAFRRRDKRRTIAADYFNGKIDSPTIAARALDATQIESLKVRPLAASLENDVVAAWDFSHDLTTTTVRDVSANRLDGEVVNMPARGMTGWNWTGDEMCWRHCANEYGAIHFHDDDVYDAGWEVDFSLTVPKRLKSGLYAARLRCGDTADTEDYVPFAVLPPRGEVTAKICFLLPTASYMAYANDHLGSDSPVGQLLGGKLVEHSPQDLFRNVHREYGASCYDTHSDGSGVCYSSRLRPVLNMRPKYRSWLGGTESTLWQFNADTHIVDWLETLGYEYDVITDEELHNDGLA
ncbi:MAG: N,N-dimethylformamidase beta subunit family domain-containing protein, partial [Gammaproteobacteria bacterium]